MSNCFKKPYPPVKKKILTCANLDHTEEFLEKQHSFRTRRNNGIRAVNQKNDNPEAKADSTKKDANLITTKRNPIGISINQGTMQIETQSGKEIVVIFVNTCISHTEEISPGKEPAGQKDENSTKHCSHKFTTGINNEVNTKQSVLDED